MLCKPRRDADNSVGSLEDRVYKEDIYFLSLEVRVHCGIVGENNSLFIQLILTMNEKYVFLFHLIHSINNDMS